ncbi:hypothetical protein [Sporosarcina highlanderae]|uniref:Uncharacterized protein n=1 Tax=Sporosarcina highlanderae TaxID=3035916 RepID=A0ABT8JWS4_9BACL|nr:hypothetical protein [Sporosarcina highlanderae]MDN4608777.1 hypothetical protein [Sporosarcina highlanderae]
MGRKSLQINNDKKEKRLKLIYFFVIVGAIMALLGSTLIISKRSVSDLYKSFVLDFIGTTLLYAAALTLCSFFLYAIFVVVVLNPMDIKRSSVIKFAFGGIFTLIITVLILSFSVNEANKSIDDMKSYSNQEWQVKDLLVTDVYRGRRPSRLVLIDTTEGEMILHREKLKIYRGQHYRFTYLDKTKTIIKVEEL